MSDPFWSLLKMSPEVLLGLCDGLDQGWSEWVLKFCWDCVMVWIEESLNVCMFCRSMVFNCWREALKQSPWISSWLTGEREPWTHPDPNLPPNWTHLTITPAWEWPLTPKLTLTLRGALTFTSNPSPCLQAHLLCPHVCHHPSFLISSSLALWYYSVGAFRSDLISLN